MKKFNVEEIKKERVKNIKLKDKEILEILICL